MLAESDKLHLFETNSCLVVKNKNKKDTKLESGVVGCYISCLDFYLRNKIVFVAPQSSSDFGLVVEKKERRADAAWNFLIFLSLDTQSIKKSVGWCGGYHHCPVLPRTDHDHHTMQNLGQINR